MYALVVDDARAMRSILTRMLSNLGFEVFSAANGREALEQLQTMATPDVMLVDWNMPEMDGRQFVEAVRSKPEYRDVRILMCTTETDQEHMTTAIAAGADEYVMKPFTEDVLREKLSLLGVSTPASS